MIKQASKTQPEDIMTEKMGCCGLDCGDCDYREQTECGGCQESGGQPFHGECKTAKCCLARGLRHCGECDDFPCSLVKGNAFHPEHGDNGGMLIRLANAAGKPILGTNLICQIGLVCRDVEAAAAAWAKLLSVPTPKIIQSGKIEDSRAELWGNPCPARCKQAFFNCGQVQIELIQPDDEPSVWRDIMEERGEGLHHIAFDIKQGMKETCAMLSTLGWPVMQKGEYTGGRYAYIDARKDLKLILELLENDS